MSHYNFTQRSISVFTNISKSTRLLFFIIVVVYHHNRCSRVRTELRVVVQIRKWLWWQNQCLQKIKKKMHHEIRARTTDQFKWLCVEWAFRCGERDRTLPPLTHKLLHTNEIKNNWRISRMSHFIEENHFDNPFFVCDASVFFTIVQYIFTS